MNLKTAAIPILGLIILANGCVHHQGRLPAADVSKTPENSSSPRSPSANSASPIVSLPYIFTWHGVEIRTDSIEFSPDLAYYIVNVTLVEKRDQTAQIPTDLLEVKMKSGQDLPYIQYSSGDQKLSAPAIPVAPHERRNIGLYYRLPNIPGSANPFDDLTVEIHFPTGRWWTSATRG